MLSRRGLLTAERRFRCTRALLFDGGGGSDSRFQTEAGKRLTQAFSRNEKEPAEEKNTSLRVNGQKMNRKSRKAKRLFPIAGTVWTTLAIAPVLVSKSALIPIRIKKTNKSILIF